MRTQSCELNVIATAFVSDETKLTALFERYAKFHEVQEFSESLGNVFVTTIATGKDNSSAAYDNKKHLDLVATIMRSLTLCLRR